MIEIKQWLYNIEGRFCVFQRKIKDLIEKKANSDASNITKEDIKEWRKLLNVDQTPTIVLPISIDDVTNLQNELDSNENLATTANTKANQVESVANALEDKIRIIEGILETDDSNLDTLQEIITRIKNIREGRETISIGDVGLLQQTLDTKAEKTADNLTTEDVEKWKKKLNIKNCCEGELGTWDNNPKRIFTKEFSNQFT